MARLAIIGYCQTVALLNALGSWREALRADAALSGVDFDDPVGWEAVNTEGQLYDLVPDAPYGALAGSRFCLLNASTHPAARYAEGGDGQIVYAAALERFLTAADGFDAVVSLVNGSELYSDHLKLDFPDFDCFPYDEDAAGLPPVDALYVDRAAHQATSWVRASLTVMRQRLPNQRIIHISPPPPLHGVSTERRVRPSLQIKWHRAVLEQLRRDTKELGVDFIEVGADALTEDGFLKPDYADGETRGNVEFGRLLAQDLLKRV